MGDHLLGLRFDAGSTDVQQIPVNQGFTTNYFQWEVDADYEYRLLKSDDRLFFLSLISQGGLSYVSGDQGNRGSHRTEGQVRAGVRAHAGPVMASFLGGLGSAFNYLNFGRGTALQLDTTLNGHIQGEVGISHCFSEAICPSLFAGYRLERTLYGSLDYLQGGWIFGFGGVFDLEIFVPEQRIEYLQGELEEARAHLKSTREELDWVNLKRAAQAPKVVVASRTSSASAAAEAKSMECLLTPEAQLPDLQYPEPLKDCLAFPTRSSKVPLDKYFHNRHLDAVANEFRRNPEIFVRLHGYATQVGDEYDGTTNVLALMRALAIKTYLVRKKQIYEPRVIVEGEFDKDDIVKEKEDVRGHDVSGPEAENLEVSKDITDFDNRRIAIELIDAQGPSVHGVHTSTSSEKLSRVKIDSVCFEILGHPKP